MSNFLSANLAKESLGLAASRRKKNRREFGNFPKVLNFWKVWEIWEVRERGWFGFIRGKGLRVC